MTTNEKLYEITNSLQSVLRIIEDAGGELTPELEKMLENADGNWTWKAERVARAMLDAQEEMAREAQYLALVQARFNKARRMAESMQTYLGRQLHRVNREIEVRVRDVPFMIYAKPSTTCVVPEKAIGKLPEICLRHVPAKVEADRNAVRRLLAEGAELPEGVEIRTTYKAAIR